jgi:hypothetical protein
MSLKESTKSPNLAFHPKSLVLVTSSFFEFLQCVILKQIKSKIMRRHDLDWLRVIVFGLLIFYHVGMFFVPWGFHIKNDIIYSEIRWPMLFVNQWRLPILFVISGMGTYYALSKRSGGQFAKERIQRLLLPLVVGIVLIVPPQVYFERLDRGQFYREGISNSGHPRHLSGFIRKVIFLGTTCGFCPICYSFLWC